MAVREPARMSLITLPLLAVLLSTACLGVAGAARPILSNGAVAAAGNPMCPDGCAEGYCVASSTGGLSGYMCQRCVSNLYVLKANGQCGCIAGRYSPNGRGTCIDCPVGSYCLGGTYTVASWPTAVRCPLNMTTRGIRGANDRACVNMPGFYYSLVAGSPGAIQCPEDTFSIGMRKQRGCAPCPVGFSTMGKVGQILPQACVVPPGYYLKAPGQVAQCPQGEYKSGTGPDPNCLSCAFGVTTAAAGSTSVNACKLLFPGWYAANITSNGVITVSKACPQGYYCPGGPAQSVFDATNPSSLSPTEPSIIACPSGMWTLDVAATSVDQCLTPPGYKTVNGATVPCEDGSFRSGWANAGAATSCTSCGTGMFALKTDRLVQYDVDTYMPTNIPVTTSEEDCYILPGQGLYYESVTQTWRARNCIANAYGVDKISYGLSAYACRSCPNNMVTSTNRTAFPNSAAWFANSTDGLGGFTSPMACVNQAGYGYNGRFSQPCDKGTYNAQDTYSPCSACGFGLTTQGVGVGKSVADCGLALGYGWDGQQVVPCPIGTYNNASYTRSTRAACTPCPQGTTTNSPGADSIAQCNLCSGGWGGPSCQTQCGGVGSNATYGDARRPMGADCTQCSWSSAGFSFTYGLQNDLFSARAVSPIGADSSWDCVSEFAQIVDGAWYIPTTGNTAMNATANITTFADCVALCTGPSCEYVTYDYRAKICYVRVAFNPQYVGAPLIAFKAIPSGDVATSYSSVQAASVIQRQHVTGSRHRHGAPTSCCGGDSTASNHGSIASQPAAAASAKVDSQMLVTASDVNRGASVSSGQYSFYVEPNADSVGVQTPAANRDSFALGFDGLQQCLNACDDQTWCAGVVMQLYVDILTSPRSCNLIRGDTNLGRLLRTVTRADMDRLSVPAIFTKQP